MVIHKYHERETDTFNQRPFFRLILNIIYDISRKNYKFDENIILTVYTAFSTLLHRLEPNNYPGFSFAWL
jgi:CCR4-NOT transcription complex subunit 1